MLSQLSFCIVSLLTFFFYYELWTKCRLTFNDLSLCPLADTQCLLTLSTFTFLGWPACKAKVSRGTGNDMATPRKAKVNDSLTNFLSPGPGIYLILTFIFRVRCSYPHCQRHLLTLDLSCVPLSLTAWLTQSTGRICTWGVHFLQHKCVDLFPYLQV